MTPGTALTTSRLWPQREAAEVPLPRRRFDAVVIGGGLTGLVSGLLLAQEGADVLVCDPLHGSRFTPAGAVLEGPAVRDLHRS